MLSIRRHYLKSSSFSSRELSKRIFEGILSHHSGTTHYTQTMTPTVPSALIRKTYVVSTSSNFSEINTGLCGDNFKFSLVEQGYSSKICSVKNFVFTRGGVEDTRLEAKAKYTKKMRGQGQGQPFRGQILSRPRTKDTSASALQKKKVFTKIFQALHKILTNQKIALSSSRGQANFRGLEASRPRPRTSKCVLEAKNVLEDSTSGLHQS